MSENVVEAAKALVSNATLLEADSVIRALLAEIERLKCQHKDIASALADVALGLKDGPVTTATLSLVRYDGETITLRLQKGKWSFGVFHDSHSAVEVVADWIKASESMFQPEIRRALALEAHRLFEHARALFPKLDWTMSGEFAFEGTCNSVAGCRVEFQPHVWSFTSGAGRGSSHNGYRSDTDVLGRISRWYEETYGMDSGDPSKVF